MSSLYYAPTRTILGQAFTPILAAVYDEINTAAKRFEVVFVTSDQDTASWKEYFSTMPWIAIPFGDARIPGLKAKYGVKGIPTLVIISPTGKEISRTARDDVQTKGPAAIDEWIKSL